LVKSDLRESLYLHKYNTFESMVLQVIRKERVNRDLFEYQLSNLFSQLDFKLLLD